MQRKLRQRSKGKFYADGWSTSHSRVNYALVAGVMLVVIVAVYLAMARWASRCTEFPQSRIRRSSVYAAVAMMPPHVTTFELTR